MKRPNIYFPQTWATRAFLAMSLVETIVDVVIVTILLNSFESSFVKTILARDEQSVLPVYLSLFILAHVFQFILSWDALAQKNTIQIVGLIIFNTLFLIYAIIQIIEIRSLVTGGLKPLLPLIPAMIAITEIAYLFMFMPLYREFGWSAYKKIGADRQLKRVYKWYQIFICILKFDVFFWLAFSLQLILLVLQGSDYERWLTVAALPVTCAILFLSYYSVKTERKALFIVTLVGFVIGAGYFVYKLFRIYQGREGDYRLVFKSLTVFDVLCLAALIWTIMSACICRWNFGRGLKYHLRKSASEMTRGESMQDLYNMREGKMEPGSKLEGKASRMSMD